jgi:hypothetical protein
VASRWTPGALSHDFGGGNPYDPPHTTGVMADGHGGIVAKPGTACHWPAAWRPIAVAILDLPVPVRDEPAEVSGEVGCG